jgi:hypothetical protein
MDIAGYSRGHMRSYPPPHLTDAGRHRWLAPCASQRLRTV